MFFIQNLLHKLCLPFISIQTITATGIIITLLDKSNFQLQKYPHCCFVFFCFFALVEAIDFFTCIALNTWGNVTRAHIHCLAFINNQRTLININGYNSFPHKRIHFDISYASFCQIATQMFSLTRPPHHKKMIKFILYCHSTNIFLML